MKSQSQYFRICELYSLLQLLSSAASEQAGVDEMEMSKFDWVPIELYLWTHIS